MKEYTLKINVPDGCNIQIEKVENKDGCEVQIEKVENKDECEFRKGDVIVTDDFIAVFEKNAKFQPEYGEVVFYSTLYHKKSGFYEINHVNFGIGTKEFCRLATYEEREILFNALKKVATKNGKKREDARKVLMDVFGISITTLIKTYQDLIDNNQGLKGCVINNDSTLTNINCLIDASVDTRNMAYSEKVAKSMLAMAMISQLMPYYGGEITQEEWGSPLMPKYIIMSNNNTAVKGNSCVNYYYLAFHREDQRDDFLRYNKGLVNDYLMID